MQCITGGELTLTRSLSVWCDSFNSIWGNDKGVVHGEDVATIQLVGGKDGVVGPVGPEQQVGLQGDGERMEDTVGSRCKNLGITEEDMVVTSKVISSNDRNATLVKLLTGNIHRQLLK